MLDDVSLGLVRGLHGFLEVSPGLGQLAKAKWLKRAWQAKSIARHTIPVIRGERTVAEAVGRYAGKKVAHRLTDPLSRAVKKAHMRAQFNKRKTTKVNGIGGRTWILPEVDADKNGRIIKNMVIIYHDANKAGKHVDIHIGHLSFIMRVSGKPVEKKLKFNSKGELTQNAKDALMSHVRSEIASHSRVPQNLDHSISNAKCTWMNGESGLTGYGSGRTRQLVSESKVEFYHTHLTGSLHMYAPAITPHQGLYLYKIYNGKTTGVAICIWGALNPRDERFKDRLHLKMIQEEDFEPRFKASTDESTTTRKYDGASTHFTTTGEGFKFFSPRFSKVTGHRIEYTYKLPELAEHGFGPVRPDRIGHTAGMGEVLFYRRTPAGIITEAAFGLRGPEHMCWSYLSAAEIGGLLNSHQVRPRDIYPEVRIYRADKFLGRDVYDLPFHANRALQKQISRVNKYFKVVSTTHLTINRNWEGLVAVPEGSSINNGYKIKWWDDSQDWEVTSVQLEQSPKGAITGVVWFRSHDSGRDFKLGPGSIGSAEQCLSMLQTPQSYVGRVAKVHSRNGHEGRAAKLVDWHADKGSM
jgi:hypothetical protein